MSNIILFWSESPKEKESLDDWINKEIQLTEFQKLPIESHKKFNNNVKLFTYQKIKQELPNNIQVCDANDIFSAKEAFESLKNGHSIAHISDLVRITSALDSNGIVLDMDAVMINQFPDIPCFTCTMPPKTTGGMAIKWGKSHPPFKIHDSSWDGKALSAFPVKIHKCIEKEILQLLDKIKNQLNKPPKNDTKGWNYIMWTLKEIASNNDQVKVFQPIHTCPVPAWKKAGNCYSLESPTRFDGKTEIFGYILPTIDKIFKETFVIQHFFESSFRGAEYTSDGFWNSIKEGSLLYKEYEYIFGKSQNKQIEAIDLFF